VVAWGQVPASERRAPVVAATARPVTGDAVITLGPGTFDARTGALTAVGGVPVSGLRLDVWRATTDNDDGAPWQPDLRYGLLWRQLGLHRMRHRLDAVETGEHTLTVRTRVAPAARELGLSTEYRWTSDGDRLRLTVSTTPEGDWTVPLPRLGIRFALPAADGVRWYGGGPGEAYPDTRAAAMAGRWQSTVDGMQTPYVRPQENGARIDVRWAELGGLRIEGDPPFLLTARRWTTGHLDAATHRSDLVPGDAVWVNLDHAQHGIGSQSCGPGPLPQYHLRAEPAQFSFVFSPAPGPKAG
jgi:beta-galactosidase